MKHNEIINANQTGENFKKIREKNEMSIDQLSKVMSGVPSSLIKRIEEGTFIPTLEYVFDFCEHFCISIDNVIASKL